MQELIEQMWEIAKYGDSYEVAPCIEAAEAMLEKEKEVMESAWQDGMYECDGDGTFEDFYKTFNTKRMREILLEMYEKLWEADKDKFAWNVI